MPGALRDRTARLRGGTFCRLGMVNSSCSGDNSTVFDISKKWYWLSMTFRNRILSW